MTQPTNSTGEIQATVPARPPRTRTTPGAGGSWRCSALAQLMVVLDATIVNIALPHAQAALASPTATGSGSSPPTRSRSAACCCSAGGSPTCSAASGSSSSASIGFAAASAFGGAAQNFGMLLTARVVQGAFGALLAPATLSLLTTTFTDPRSAPRPSASSAASPAPARPSACCSAACSPSTSTGAGAVRERAHRGVALSAPSRCSSTVAAPQPAQARPGRHRAGRRRPVRLVYGFSNASMSPQQRLDQARHARHLIGGAVLLVAFVLVEQRVAHPLLPLRVIADRNRGGSYLSMFFAALGMFGVFLFLTYYLEETLGGAR